MGSMGEMGGSWESMGEMSARERGGKGGDGIVGEREWEWRVREVWAVEGERAWGEWRVRERGGKGSEGGVGGVRESGGVERERMHQAVHARSFSILPHAPMHIG